MTTIISGGSASLSLNPFDYLDVTASRPCIGAISAVSGAPNLQPSQSFGIQNRRYGPFGVPMQMTISVAAGSMDYTVTEGSGGAGVISATAAEIAALALAGTLAVPGIYFDSATGLYSFTQTASTYETQQQGIFRGTYAWAARPVTGLTVGDTIRASDVGLSPGTMFMWTGSRWKNLHRFLLARNVGSVASPVASLGTGITSGNFTIPNPLATFADLLEAGDSLVIRALVTRAGTGGTNDVTVYLGTAGTTGDSQARNETLTAVANRTTNIVTQVYFSSTTSFVATAAVEENGVATAALVDRTTNVNLAAAMTVTIAISAANAADSWKMLACSLEVL